MDEEMDEDIEDNMVLEELCGAGWDEVGNPWRGHECAKCGKGEEGEGRAGLLKLKSGESKQWSIGRGRKVSRESKAKSPEPRDSYPRSKTAPPLQLIHKSNRSALRPLKNANFGGLLSIEGSVALGVMRSVKSLARIRSWAYSKARYEKMPPKETVKRIFEIGAPTPSAIEKTHPYYQAPAAMEVTGAERVEAFLVYDGRYTLKTLERSIIEPISEEISQSKDETETIDLVPAVEGVLVEESGAAAHPTTVHDNQPSPEDEEATEAPTSKDGNSIQSAPAGRVNPSSIHASVRAPYDIYIKTVYASNMPTSLPTLLHVKELIQQVFFALFFGLRGIAVGIIWLTALPWATVSTWRMHFSMGESTPGEFDDDNLAPEGNVAPRPETLPPAGPPQQSHPLEEVLARRRAETMLALEALQAHETRGRVFNGEKPYRRARLLKKKKARRSPRKERSSGEMRSTTLSRLAEEEEEEEEEEESDYEEERIRRMAFSRRVHSARIAGTERKMNRRSISEESSFRVNGGPIATTSQPSPPPLPFTFDGVKWVPSSSEAATDDNASLSTSSVPGRSSPPTSSRVVSFGPFAEGSSQAGHDISTESITAAGPSHSSSQGDYEEFTLYFRQLESAVRSETPSEDESDKEEVDGDGEGDIDNARQDGDEHVHVDLFEQEEDEEEEAEALEDSTLMLGKLPKNTERKR
ncbi:hypothetical protein H0H93_011828 [Arthromyces matolae]|nr:hypothetical protein H0H93_011828 [Arthromyces matolae]